MRLFHGILYCFFIVEVLHEIGLKSIMSWFVRICTSEAKDECHAHYEEYNKFTFKDKLTLIIYDVLIKCRWIISIVACFIYFLSFESNVNWILFLMNEVFRSTSLVNGDIVVYGVWPGQHLLANELMVTSEMLKNKLYYFLQILPTSCLHSLY